MINEGRLQLSIQMGLTDEQRYLLDLNGVKLKHLDICCHLLTRGGVGDKLLRAVHLLAALVLVPATPVVRAHCSVDRRKVAVNGRACGAVPYHPKRT